VTTHGPSDKASVLPYWELSDSEVRTKTGPAAWDFLHTCLDVLCNESSNGF
jgi:hypothetical protein